MSHNSQEFSRHADVAPGDERLNADQVGENLINYLIGLFLATLLTAVSFFVSQTTLVWQPSIPVALSVLAAAQIGVHLVFFLHIGTGPESTNNIIALAFGLLIVFLVITGSIWIIANLNWNMMDMPR